MFSGTCTHIIPHAHPMWFQGSSGPGDLIRGNTIKPTLTPFFLPLSPICTLQDCSPSLGLYSRWCLLNPPRLVLVQFLGFFFSNTS